jgi:hypothetical protein|tara:strand:+ start:1675 stop:2358 length:684 start_codon:yes stop_codon:yes gene_type:complete
MKFKKIYLLIVFLIFSACEVKWNMELKFNEDYSGTYKIFILIDQDAQLYALETGQSSSIGGLDAILSDLPEGFGSSIYQEGDYLGILVRNDFTDTENLQEQLELLNENENTSLLLLPIEEINFSENRNSFRIDGIFGEIFVSDEESADGYDNVFDGQLTVIVPGKITKPNLENIVENTIIFEIEGISAKTFEVDTSTNNFFSPSNIILIFLLTSLIYFIVRQYLKKK